MGKCVKSKDLAVAVPTPRFPSFLPRTEHDYRDQARTDTLLSIAPHLSAPVAPRRGEATRTNERWAIHDPTFADALYTETDLKTSLVTLGLAQSGNRHLVGLNSNIRVYRYQVGSFFGPHYDDSITDHRSKSRSEWTLLIYLTEGDLLGGETAFELQNGKSLAPKVKDGMALIHRHGKDCLLHEGRPVKQGIKWVLRSDLMYSL